MLYRERNAHGSPWAHLDWMTLAYEAARPRAAPAVAWGWWEEAFTEHRAGEPCAPDCECCLAGTGAPHCFYSQPQTIDHPAKFHPADEWKPSLTELVSVTLTLRAAQLAENVLANSTMLQRLRQQSLKKVD